MKRLLIGMALVAGLAMGGCEQMQAVRDAVAPSPEAGIANASNGTGVAAALGTVLLKNKKISVVQAKSYSAILHSASTHLHDTNGVLLACRTRTGSNSHTSPDPCRSTVEQDIALVIALVGDVKKALDAKQ